MTVEHLYLIVFFLRHQRHCQLQGSHETVSFPFEIMCFVLWIIIIMHIFTEMCIVLLNI